MDYQAFAEWFVSQHSLDGVVDVHKTRYVKTPAGERKYDAPIGSPIGKGGGGKSDGGTSNKSTGPDNRSTAGHSSAVDKAMADREAAFTKMTSAQAKHHETFRDVNPDLAKRARLKKEVDEATREWEDAVERHEEAKKSLVNEPQQDKSTEKVDARRSVAQLVSEHGKLDGSNAGSSQYNKERNYLQDVAESGYAASGTQPNVARSRAQDDLNSVQRNLNKERKAGEEDRLTTPEERNATKASVQDLEHAVADGIKARRDSFQIADRDELNREVSADRAEHEDDYGRMYTDVKGGSDDYTQGSYDRAKKLTDELERLNNVDHRLRGNDPKSRQEKLKQAHLQKVLERMVAQGNPAYSERASQIVKDGMATKKGTGKGMDDLIRQLQDPNKSKAKTPFHDMMATAANGFDVEKKRLFEEWGLG